jgi:major membrane immunogen (membrane-anchored lipoprotein)
VYGKIVKTGLGIVAVLLLIAGLVGCSQSKPTESLAEPGYAGAIAENILQSFNTGDYAAYSEHFDEAMKKAMPEAAFQDTAALIQRTIGDYISKEFDRTETDDIYTAVIYRAKFSEEPGVVTVRVVFLETDDNIFVSGLWFDSPKLRAK